MELIESIKDTIGKRVNSAFSGTFILVWIGFNWRLIFALFYFDKGFNFSAKIEWIENYFKTHDKYDTLICPILITFASYITYQLFNTITYAIGTFVNLQLKPRVLSLIKKDMMYSKDDYLKLNKLHIELTKTSQDNQDKLINSETDKKIIQTENEELNNKIIELNEFAESQKHIIDNNTKNQTDVMNLAINEWQKSKQNLIDDNLKLGKIIEEFKKYKLLDMQVVAPTSIFVGRWVFDQGGSQQKLFYIDGNNFMDGKSSVVLYKSLVTRVYSNDFIVLSMINIDTNENVNINILKLKKDSYVGVNQSNLSSVEFRKTVS